MLLELIDNWSDLNQYIPTIFIWQSDFFFIFWFTDPLKSFFSYIYIYIYTYIYIHIYTSKNPTLLYVTAVNIKKSHIFPYRYISELHTFSRLFIFILPSNVMLIASLILKQGVQGLQAFTFCILIINDEHTKQT